MVEDKSESRYSSPKFVYRGTNKQKAIKARDELMKIGAKPQLTSDIDSFDSILFNLYARATWKEIDEIRKKIGIEKGY